MKCVSRIIVIDAIDIEWCHVMNDQNKLEAAWPKTLSETYYPKANLGDVPQTFDCIMNLLHKICGPSGIFLTYCVIDLLVTLTYEYYKTNYPTKDKGIIKRAPISTSSDMGTDI